MSSVSGGSIATSYWAESYLDQKEGTTFDSTDLLERTECSSLEAAAWGVLYPDFNQVLVWKDLAARVLGLQRFDRGWALAEAFERNRFGGAEGSRPNGLASVDPCSWGKWKQKQVGHYTFANLRAELVNSRNMPAFAFNTTIADDGGRLLLSNYTLPEPAPPATQKDNLDRDSKFA